MKLSPGAQLCLAVSVAEAQLIGSVELEPEHFLLALLKLEDISADQVQALGPHLATKALSEAKEIANFWETQGVPAPNARRRLRYLVKRSQGKEGGFSGHRSARGKKLFARAEQYSEQKRQGEITPAVLLVCCLEMESQPASELFAEMGVSRQDLLKEAQRLFRRGEQPEPDTRAVKHQEHPLAQYGRDLTALARAGRLGPIIGRNEEIKEVARILVQRSKNNPLLLGDPGVGKTAIVEGLALYAAGEHAISPLRDFHFVEISAAALVAGAVYRGQFEERLQEVIQLSREDRNLILFLDELHTLMGAGAGGSSALDAANILKPALARGEIRCIGATTIDEYRKHVEPDGALARRFQIVWVNEPSPAETLLILRGLRPKLQEHHQIEIPDEALEKAVTLSGRYLTDGYQPDKAITVLDEACARRRLLTIHAQSLSGTTSRLEIEDVGQVVARRTQIPSEVILQSDEERLLRLEEELKKRVLGQDQAVRAVAEAVRVSRAGLRAPGKPIVLLFAGPSGTGKSELAKALSDFLFFDPGRLITLDMTEYQESHSVAKLIGSPPGYVGFGDEPYLVRELRLHPYSVVLLDEIEKAHPNVLITFMQVFDEGRLTDARGRRINCSEAIFILTSNLGVEGVKPKSPIGFKAAGAEEKSEHTLFEEQVRRAIVAGLRPELVNRIQEIVVFNFLSQDVLYRILDIYVAGLEKQLIQRGISVSLDQSAKNYLIEVGYHPDYGARHLRRAFDRWVAEPLSRELLGGNLKSGNQVLFSCQESRLVMNIQGTRGVQTIRYQPEQDA